MYKNLANQQFLDEKYMGALDNYKISITNSEPEKSDTFRNMSRIYLRQNNLDESLSFIKKAINENNNKLENWNLLVDILKLQGKNDEVDVALKQISSLENSLTVDHDTETEDEDDELQFNNLNIPNKDEMFKKFMENDKLKNVINEPEFQKKILNAKSNPMDIFNDKSIMDVMSEMAKTFNVNT